MPWSVREPNWEAIRAYDTDPGRGGWGGHIVHMGRDNSTAASVCGRKRCTFAILNWSFVTCEACLRELVIVGHLKDGTPVHDARPSAEVLALRGITIDELAPGEAPVAYLNPICIVGVKKKDGVPPITIATAEEYRAYFHCDPPPDWFQPVTVVVPIADAPAGPWPALYPEPPPQGAQLEGDRPDWRKP